METRYKLRHSGDSVDKTEIEEIIGIIDKQGYVLLWSMVLKDYVAFYRDEEAKAKIPPEITPYSEDELCEMFGEGRLIPSPQVIRMVHEAKKNGARVAVDL